MANKQKHKYSLGFNTWDQIKALAGSAKRKIFVEFFKKEERHCNSENIEDLREVQRQIYRTKVQVSLKPFSSKK